MSAGLPNRESVSIEETWKLEDLVPNEAAYEEGLVSLTKATDAFVQQWKGSIHTSEDAVTALKAYEEIYLTLIPVSTYGNLALSVDQTNTEAQMRASKFGSFYAGLGSKLAFLDSELLNLNEKILMDAAHLAPEFAQYLDKLIKKKPHQLAPEVEKTLASLSSTFDGPYELYNTTKMVDLSFPDFEANGSMHPMSYVKFENDYEVENDTELRRNAFDAFSKELANYQHTTAKTYDMHLQTEKTLSDLRGYNTIFDSLLFSQEVDASLYHRQIDLIMKELAPHMRKYAKLLGRIHGIDKMTFADLKISVDPSYEPKISIEESKKYMYDALGIMGEDYIEMVRKSYDERWIDFAANKGKSTGAFCSSPYGVHPYILISWSSRMNEVFVLAHELGHAGHFYLAQQEQSVFNSRPSLYFIEAPSTMNEMLTANHLMKNSDDPRFKRWVISSIVARTYYHNFVTHLLEAAYQRKVYDHVDNGGNVHAGLLNEWTREVLQEFWGDDVEINDGAEYTWMRQPHYYMGLYPYTYSAGLTIATEVSQKILSEGQPAVDRWIDVLKAGGTKTPAELAQMAGVDITTEQPLRNTISYIGSLIDELETLTKEIEGK
ncbi:oligoendopeptidase F [Paenisporosarcina cavernae]|uniref:Oligopeptidase F n=1 Tax=Paenisporosarcina cavernae TaxID=2320858 RepID=A0A385YT23_9BACL|nr:oligoendopeptidase F [Paenisporosarcina cavernae]AYC28603.1 oligoendopeptidase F [Paenisporosarcina cavernae]